VCTPLLGQLTVCTSGDVYGIEQRGIQALRDDWRRIIPERCPALWQVIAGPEARCNAGIALLDPSPSYRYLAFVTENFSKRPSPLARLSCLNESVALDVRGPDGGVQHLVLRGPDPLLIERDGVASSILHVHFLPNSVEQIVFVQTTGRLTRELGRKIYDAVADRLGVPPVVVKIRNDSFFVETGFPPLYPFSDDPVPSEREYLKTIMLSCSNSGCGMIPPE
jgi:hypothetical protein